MSDVEFGRSEETNSTDLGATQSKLPFTFNGTGKEYFGIWIVNILLSIVTLGIYSAWAKVRTKRYFNGNLELDGHRFDYHAKPVAILIGRIIVVVVLIVMGLISQLHPLLSIGVSVFYIIALPWIIVRGLRFNANMTSYRNIRFHFEGLNRNAFVAYILLPIIATLSLGLIVPYASRANARFLGNGHRFGGSAFSANPPLKPYFKALGIVYLLVVLPLVLYFMGIAILQGHEALIRMAPIGVLLMMFIIAPLAYSVYSRNIFFNNMRLAGGHRFSSTVKLKSFLWIFVTNFLLTIITLGIYIPWAKVRIANYLAENTTMLIAGDLDEFVAGQTVGTGVVSGEFLDIEGLDFGP